MDSFEKEKAKKRREDNRLSAQRSRERKRKYTEDLEQQVEQLAEEVETLRSELFYIENKYKKLKETLRKRDTPEKEDDGRLFPQLKTKYMSYFFYLVSWLSVMTLRVTLCCLACSLRINSSCVVKQHLPIHPLNIQHPKRLQQQFHPVQG